jgi:nicotinamidase-related amidase
MKHPLRIPPETGDALVIVDLQNDFLPGGSLSVPHGDEVVPVVNAAIAEFQAGRLPIFATRNLHPLNHCSFMAQGGPWPAHCVAGTQGADLAPGLALPLDAVIISKAATADEDAYSGFAGTELDQRLRAAGVRRIFVGGLATDYCVLNTVKDALSAGYEVVLMLDAIRAVEVNPGDSEQAISEMKRLGALVI